MATVQKPVTDCQCCHNLKLMPTQNLEYYPFTDFKLGISQRSCQYCGILLEAITGVLPSLLTTAGLLGPPVTAISIRAKEHGIVDVSVDKGGWVTQEGEFQLYWTDDMKPCLGLDQPLRDVATTAGAISMWEFLRSCLNDCVDQHPGCTQRQSNIWFPKRLLLLEYSAAGSCEARLIETQREPPQSPYIALSHCWGGKSHLRTTRDNIDRLRQRIDLDELPNTFRDCVTVAGELSIKYVWIDSLCIVQDDRTDWAVQSQSMWEVYHNAFLTVAAVASPNSSIPFLGPNAPSLRRQCQAIDISRERSSVRIKARDLKVLKSGSGEPKDQPLYMRAWAWQERLFSQRTISFLQQKVTWQCKTVHRCESGMAEEPSPLPLEEPGGQSLVDGVRDWSDLVQVYCQRRLTYPADRLPALSGVASRFRRRQDSLYLAGLWADHFPLCLAWSRKQPHDQKNVKVPIEKFVNNKVPSWSWASVVGRVTWSRYSDPNESGTHVDEIEIQSRVELLRSHCQPSSENVFGEVKRGSHLSLRGKVVKATLILDKYGSGCVRRRGLRAQVVTPDCQVSADSRQNHSIFSKFKTKLGDTYKSSCVKRAAWNEEAIPSGFERLSGPVVCLLLFTAKWKGRTPACALILTPHPEFEGAYQRLGIGHGDFGIGPPDYSVRKHWAEWSGWEELEEWEKWEEWFADGEVRTLHVA